MASSEVPVGLRIIGAKIFIALPDSCQGGASCAHANPARASAHRKKRAHSWAPYALAGDQCECA
jgi:hypothetical protein